MGSRGPIPEDVAACRQLSQQGVAALDRGSLDQAESLLQQAVEVCPTDASARCRYAEALCQQGQTRQALTQLEAGLKNDPDDVLAVIRAGELSLQLDDFQSAMLRAEQALETDIDQAGAWALRSQVHAACGQYDRALADLHRALRYRPDDRELLLELAELYRTRRQPQRALATLHYLAELYPPGEEPRRVLHRTGLAYGALGRHRDACEALYAASIHGPPDAEILCHLAQAELSRGDREVAVANLREALAIDPQHQASRTLMSRLNPHATHSAKVLR